MDKRQLSQLITRICNDDKLAFDELFLAYYEKLVQFAHYSVHQTDLAQDVVADVFTKLWYKRKQLPHIDNIEAYLYTSVRNGCFDQLKRVQKVVMMPETQTSSSVHLETQELKKRLQNAVQALPEQQRLVFLLVKEHGHKPAEVAKILNISTRTVENHLYKAVKTLADVISRYLGYHPQDPLRKQSGLLLFFSCSICSELFQFVNHLE